MNSSLFQPPVWFCVTLWESKITQTATELKEGWDFKNGIFHPNAFELVLFVSSLHLCSQSLRKPLGTLDINRDYHEAFREFFRADVELNEWWRIYLEFRFNSFSDNQEKTSQRTLNNFYIPAPLPGTQRSYSHTATLREKSWWIDEWELRKEKIVIRRDVFVQIRKTKNIPCSMQTFVLFVR